MKISEEAATLLKYYVYFYVNPSDGNIFYVGKGKGDRFLYHLHDNKDCDKVKTIHEVYDKGLEPYIYFLRYGLTESEAELVESAVIDLFPPDQLTNLKSGKIKGNYGIMSAFDLLTFKEGPKDGLRGMNNKGKVLDLRKNNPKTVTHKAILITINQLFRYNISDLELYETTRGIWKIGPNRDQAEYAMAVYQGIVREVYKIKKWHPAGTLKYKTRDSEGFSETDRWEFEGSVAKDIRDQYVHEYVGKGNQNPIQYRNI